MEDVITQLFDASELCHKPQVVKQYEKIHGIEDSVPAQAGSSMYQLGFGFNTSTVHIRRNAESFFAKIIGDYEPECFYETFLIMHALYDVTHQVGEVQRMFLEFFHHWNFHKRSEIASKYKFH